MLVRGVSERELTRKGAERQFLTVLSGKDNTLGYSPCERTIPASYSLFPLLTRLVPVVKPGLNPNVIP